MRMMFSHIRNEHEVQSDGKTVWVNGRNGFMIARFSQKASEIVPTNTNHIGPTNIGDWGNFQLMLHKLGVDVEDLHMPDFLKREAA